MTAVQVETFECQETAAEPIEATQEAIALCEQLGLAGQLSLCKRGDKPADAKRSPYRDMTAEERFVYRILCPRAVKLAEYRESPIPLRVLQIASHYKTLELPCAHLHVWDKLAHEIKDPVLVATDFEYSSIYSYTKIVILARWGEVLEPFAVLMKRAIEIGRQNLRDRAAKIVAEIDSATPKELMDFSRQIWVYE